MDVETALIRVEVAYALPERQILLVIEVPDGTTARAALLGSGIASHFASHLEGVELESVPVGIFGHRLEDPHNHVLAAGDRLEIYRPLAVAPREARRKRAGVKSRRG
jgi:putative ubiquitin-RnfH superfamily antitoxin RatB of RatAB toxin-antitoxin module